MNVPIFLKAVLLLIAMNLFVLPVQAKSIALFTYHGVFLNCKEANHFRDKILIHKLGKEFKRYAAGVQRRYDRTIKELRTHARRARTKANARTVQQRRQLAINTARFIAGRVLSNWFGRGLPGVPEEIRVKLSRTEISLLENVGQKGLQLAADVANNNFSAPTPNEEISDAARELALDILSKMVPRAVPIINIAFMTIDLHDNVLTPYLNQKIQIDIAQADYDQLAKTIRELIFKSPDTGVRMINRTKNQIDKACH